VAARDEGVGCNQEAGTKLFETFDMTTRSGMGIGLSGSRSLIARHHGRILSELNDGPGATSSFTIPRAPERTPVWAW
jgi:signal transduction histidine kinase